MKRLLSLFAIIALVATAGCEKSGEESAKSTFSLEKTEINATADGGAQSVAYTIENPQQGAVVLSKCSANWIKDLSTAIVGEINFTIAPNYTDKVREATIEVQYTAVDEKFQIKITQEASDKPMFDVEVVINEPTRLSVNITPADLTTAYLCRIYTEEHVKVFELEDNEVFGLYDMEVIEDEAYFMGQSTINYLNNISHTGKSFDIEFTRLYPDTNYILFCYHVDLKTGSISSDIYREVIRTAKPESQPFDVDMSVEVNGTVITQTITPADKETYYYTYCWSESDFYNYYGTDAVMEEVFVAKWNESVSIAVGQGRKPEQLVEEVCYKGDKVIILDELKASTDYVVYLFAVNKETGFAASDIILERVRTNEAEESGMTIDIEVKNVMLTTADIYWTASDANGKFARSYVTKAEFDSWGTTDEEKIASFTTAYIPISFFGATDMNAMNLTPGTTYVAFAYGLDGETPNTGIFAKEFTTLSDTPGTSNIDIDFSKHYNIAEVATVDAEHYGDYADYTNNALVQMSVGGVVEGDEVYIMVTTFPKNYYSNEAEWLRDVAQEQNRVNCYSNYNYIAEYERKYTVIAVAKDKNGNYGKLFIEQMYLYRSDDKPASEYTYIENK